jgi:wobble nucleotide-excising tRNase
MISSAPCFGGEPISLGPLGDVTFAFGANGSGKTTISRALADAGLLQSSAATWRPGSGPLVAKVYNRDYVRDTLAQANALPGVFFLGGGSPETRAEIERLRGAGGVIGSLKSELARLTATLGSEESESGKRGEIKAARDRLTEAAWQKREQVPEALAPMFAGTRGSKKVFCERLLATSLGKAEQPEDVQALVAEAATVFDDSATELAAIELLVPPSVQDRPGYQFLETSVVGAADVDLAELIDLLGSSDWVAEGMRYLEHSRGVCPFCQETVPEGLEDKLRGYFDKRYQEQLHALRSFSAWYESATDEVISRLRELRGTEMTHVDFGVLARFLKALESVVAQNRAELKEKLEKPSRIAKIQPIDDLIAAANEVLAQANLQIEQHNRLVQNKRQARSDLIDKCWRYFAGQVVNAELATFRATAAPLEVAVKRLSEKIESKSRELEAVVAELRRLEHEVRSSATVIDDINSMLESVGFESFRLTAAKGGEGYSLVRTDGAPVNGTLSEGECTFITFLYYIYQLRDESVSSEDDRGVLAVIDDPISSLDSDVLFVVSTLIRQLIAARNSGEGRVRQILVLTHNAYFHREVTYRRHGESDAGRQYLLLRKRAGQATAITAHSENPVKSPYRSLWDEVRDASRDPGSSRVALQNVMRRIVESYFRTMGGVNEDQIFSKFAGAELLVCRSLFSWLNDGSHTIVDDAEHCPSDAATDVWLDVFKKVFERTGNAGHYEMMMNVSG